MIGLSVRLEASMNKLTHIDKAGRPRMVDITSKPETRREAVTKGVVSMKAETLKLIQEGQIAKGIDDDEERHKRLDELLN